MTKEELRGFWAARVKEFKASGQSAPTWCNGNAAAEAAKALSGEIKTCPFPAILFSPPHRRLLQKNNSL